MKTCKKVFHAYAHLLQRELSGAIMPYALIDKKSGRPMHRADDRLAYARELAARPTLPRQYWTPTLAIPRGNDGATFSPEWSRFSKWRWLENPSRFGVRFAGYAHDFGIDHTGWFTDSEGFGETITGVVFRLPGGRAVYGVDNKVNGNADSGGPCMICVSDVSFTQNDECTTSNRQLRRMGKNGQYELSDVASWADGAAESFCGARKGISRRMARDCRCR